MAHARDRENAICRHEVVVRTVLERGDPREYRDQLVALFELQGMGGFNRLFDWYYSEHGSASPISWLLRDPDSGEVLGLCSVVHRSIRWNGVSLKLGVPGNTIAHPHLRSGLAVFEMLRAVKSLVSEGELDILLGVPRVSVEPLLLRIGFQHLGHLESFSLVNRSGEALRSRLGSMGVGLSPIVDVWFALRRLSRSHNIPHFRVTELSDRELDGIDFTRWKAPKRQFVIQPSAAYLRWRFHAHPSNDFRILGLADRSSARICGYVVAVPDGRTMRLFDCRTDAGQLSEATAILNVLRYARARWNKLSVDTLHGCSLSATLRKAGFIRLPARSRHEAPRFVACWREDHPLAGEFAQPCYWNLFPGFNDV